MSAHTPGPWTINEEEDGRFQCFSIYDGKGYQCGIVYDVNGAAANKANACLIAAAPDLLEALEELVRHQEVLGRHNTIIDKSRAAIARAKGAAVCTSEEGK